MKGPPREQLAKSAIHDPNSEAALGGADAVPDTPDLARHGTAPGSPLPVTAPPTSARRRNPLVWFAVIVALGIVLAYAAGMLR
ncbi:MAG TPA: hypothetical protein VGO33_02150 [Gemmatimonadaceae bacterium]|nr:hypothetical protein [Gemmatimonadaceae bacterium]